MKMKKNTEVALKLIDKGADINVKNNNKCVFSSGVSLSHTRLDSTSNGLWESNHNAQSILSIPLYTISSCSIFEYIDEFTKSVLDLTANSLVGTYPFSSFIGRRIYCLSMSIFFWSSCPRRICINISI